MRWITTRPILLCLTLMFVISAIVSIELHLYVPYAAGLQPKADIQPKGDSQSAGKAKNEAGTTGETRGQIATENPVPAGGDAGKEPERALSDAERISNKNEMYEQANEIT